MKRISFLFLICFFCNVVSLSVYGAELIDIVYLKNGSVIKGTIIETIPDVSIKIQTRDGSVFVYKMSKIERYGKEEVKRGKTSMEGLGDAEKLIQYGEMKSAGMWKWTCYLGGGSLMLAGIPVILGGISTMEYGGGMLVFMGGAVTAGGIGLFFLGQKFANKEKRLKREYGTGSLFDIQKEEHRWSYNTGLPLIGIDPKTGKSTVTLLTYKF